MKIFVIENNYEVPVNDELSWYFLADSALTNTGKPFYLPEKHGNVIVSLSVAVKISRLGKFISQNFAPRYYGEFAPALHFRLPDFEKKLVDSGRSPDASRSFDRSLFVGDYSPAKDFKIIKLFQNGVKVAEFDVYALANQIDKLISSVSVMNTLKMGDILLPGLSGNIELKEGDLLEVKQDDLVSFIVKVK